MSGIKICLISTTGGHLNQLLQLKEVYEKYEHYFVTIKSEYAEQALRSEKFYYMKQILRNPLNLFINLFESLTILKSERPDVLITTGAGDALPTCYLGKLMGIKVIFIETFARVSIPSFFGILVHPISDLTIVQWEALLESYKGSVHGGFLYDIQPSQSYAKDGPQKTFVTVGTHFLNFNRLLKELDILAEKGTLRGKVVAQIGHSSYEPKNYEWFTFVDPNRFAQYIRESDLIITHDGSTAIGTALSEGKITVVVPRLKEYGEASYDNKYDLARALEKENMIILVRDIKELEKAVVNSRDFRSAAKVRESNVVRLVNDYVGRV